MEEEIGLVEEELHLVISGQLVVLAVILHRVLQHFLIRADGREAGDTSKQAEVRFDHVVLSVVHCSVLAAARRLRCTHLLHHHFHPPLERDRAVASKLCAEAAAEAVERDHTSKCGQLCWLASTDALAVVRLCLLCSHHTPLCSGVHRPPRLLAVNRHHIASQPSIEGGGGGFGVAAVVRVKLRLNIDRAACAAGRVRCGYLDDSGWHNASLFQQDGLRLCSRPAVQHEAAAAHLLRRGSRLQTSSNVDIGQLLPSLELVDNDRAELLEAVRAHRRG
mmetsp:Transcript_34535/g.89467  ORF Transcript_34535/g.89467 Transcript_34535/m.89467 type:complete len:277 (-) Transcript_34535:1365-2195(-)